MKKWTLPLLKRVVIVSALPGFMFVAIACGSGEKKVSTPITRAQNGGNLTPEGAAKADGDKTTGIGIGSPSDLLGNKPINFVDSVYKISVKMGRFSICEGNIKVEVNIDINNLESGQLLKLPAGWVDCTLLGKIDLTAIVGILSTNAKMPKVKVDNSVIFIEEFGQATYNPPRPFLPSFLAASKKSLKSLDFSNNISITDHKTNVSAKGTAGVRMLGFNTTYQSALLDKKFNKVMHFQSTTTGFDNVDKVGNFLFENLELRLNLSPIVLISLKTRGKANGLTTFAFENLDKFPPNVQDMLKIIPSKHNPGNILSPLFGGLADTISRAIDISADLEIAEYSGPEETPASEDDGKDKFGDSKDE